MRNEQTTQYMNINLTYLIYELYTEEADFLSKVPTIQVKKE